MTAPSTEYIEYILEHLRPISSLQTSRFFGGLGISNGFVQFAMMMGNSLYFVVDDGSRKKYEQAGMQAFSYMTKKGCIQVRRYYEVPEEVLTDSEQLRHWANEAMCVAEKTKKPSKAVKKRL